MKYKVRSSDIGSPKSPQSYHKYLKPGELAQLRYSKITARSKKIAVQTMLALRQLESSLNSAFVQPQIPMDGLPCFDLRVKGYPRCFQRKKLLATRPYFMESQS